MAKSYNELLELVLESERTEKNGGSDHMRIRDIPKNLRKSSVDLAVTKAKNKERRKYYYDDDDTISARDQGINDTYYYKFDRPLGKNGKMDLRKATVVNQKYLDDRLDHVTAEAFDRAQNAFTAKEVAVAATALSFATIKGIKLIEKLSKKQNGSDKIPKNIAEECNALMQEADRIAEKSKNGEISPLKAKIETKKIQNRLRKLLAKVEKKQEDKSVDVKQ